MAKHTRLLLSIGTSCALVLGMAYSAAAATTYPYGDLSGTNYDFLSNNETVQTADDESAPLFEAPSVLGDQLVFTPSSFDADSSNADGGVGGGSIDTTHSTFNTTIMSTGAGFVDLIYIEEAGDITLGAFPPNAGTLATAVTASLAGTVTILDSTNAADIGQIINFGGSNTPFPAVFDPDSFGDTSSLYKGLHPTGTFGWTGEVTIDINSLFQGVTKVELQYNNILQANSETNTSSLIQKKAVSGPKITVIPEPGTLVLMGPGLIILGIRGRRQAT